MGRQREFTKNMYSVFVVRPAFHFSGYALNAFAEGDRFIGIAEQP